jgi:hypothetical protein
MQTPALAELLGVEASTHRQAATGWKRRLQQFHQSLSFAGLQRDQMQAIPGLQVFGHPMSHAAARDAAPHHLQLIGVQRVAWQ